MPGPIVRCLVLALTIVVLLHGSEARGQMPAGFELALVDVDGTKQVLGRLPPTVYAPRISPDGRRIAFETRDLSGPDGPRLWTADLSNIAGRRPAVPHALSDEQVGPAATSGHSQAKPVAS